jgi:lipoprotein-releasing system permease protein
LVTEVLEDYAYLRYQDANQIVTLKGVSSNFVEHKRLNDAMVAGALVLSKDSVDYAIVGQGIEINLSIDVTNPLYPLQLYYIKNPSAKTLDISALYNQRNIAPGGVFSIVQNFNDNYILVPLHFAQALMGAGNKRTSLEIKTVEGADLRQVQQHIKAALGPTFSVLTHEEQHQDLYKLVKMEKLFTFLAFSLLLAIGAINIFFSLMMLALDKKKDISVLVAMGADAGLIRKIFVSEGAFIAFLGTFLGLLFGGLVCWLQLEFGLVSMGMEAAVIDGYPIKPIAADFFLTLGIVSLITVGISYHPARLAARAAAVKHL